jgi:hypothetical protein|nr:hypothetical protein [Kofleriaceae bacterium]
MRPRLLAGAFALVVITAACGHGAEPSTTAPMSPTGAAGSASGSAGSAGATASAPAGLAVPAAGAPDGVVFHRDGHELRATHAIADIGPNDMTIFVSAVPLTCASLHDDATMTTTGVAALVPIGPLRDYYAGSRIGVALWSLGEDTTYALPAALVTVALDRVDAAAHRVSGGLAFAGRASPIGDGTTSRALDGAGRFDAEICDPLHVLDHLPARPAVHADAPFAGRVAGHAFTPAHAFAITCGRAGARYITRLVFAADSDARCGVPCEGEHVDLDTVGGAAEAAPILHVTQPAGSVLGNDLGAQSRPGTASVRFDRLELAPGGTVSGVAQVDSLDGSDRDGNLATEASGTFTATVCAGDSLWCRGAP